MVSQLYDATEGSTTLNGARNGEQATTETTRVAYQRQLTAHIAAHLPLLWTPGTVTEMAVFDKRGQPVRVGWFNDAEQFTSVAATETMRDDVGAVYHLPNPVNPDLLSWGHNRLKACGQGTPRTGDTHITKRNRLWLELDPKRLTNIPATDAEHDAAIAKARAMRDWLRDECGLPAPLLLDSGNGAYLIWPCDLPNDGATTAAIQACYDALAARFNDPDGAAPRVEVDTTIANPSRLMRAIGTKNRKGDPSGDRKHRSVKVLERPETTEPVTPEMLKFVAAHARQTQAEATNHAEPTATDQRANPTGTAPDGATGGAGAATGPDGADAAQFPPRRERGRAGEAADFDLERWIDDVLRPWCAANGRTLSAGKSWQGTGKLWQFDKCPWNADHAPQKAFVGRAPVSDEAPHSFPTAGCLHASCAENKWLALRNLVEPGWRERARGAGDGPKRRDLTTLVELAEKHADEFILSTEGLTYARLRDHDRPVVWDVGSAEFRGWLIERFRDREGQVPSDNALKDAVKAIANTALYRQRHQRRPVALRIGADPNDPGTIYFDMADGTQRAIQIDAAGFRVVPGDDVPVLFQTVQGAKPLPEPVVRGTLWEELPKWLNPGLTDDDVILLIAWLVRAASPTGPYWHLNLNGEKGTAKSTGTRLLRAIPDPNDTPLGTTPRSELDLAVVARHNRIPTFDNMGGLKPDLSDTLCVLATGGGIKTRTLYTNGEQFTLKLSRPAILNGISESVRKSDLMDRTIRVSFPRIAGSQRINENVFWQRDFPDLHPYLLGALCNALATALRELPRIQQEEGERPRMADAYDWVRAAEPALGWEPVGRFAAAYKAQQEDADAGVLEDDAVARALHTLLRCWDYEQGNPPTWERKLTVIELFAKLDPLRDGGIFDKWPTEPSAQAAFLRMVAPNFATAGYYVEVLPKSQRKQGRTQVRIAKLPVATEARQGAQRP